MMDVFQRSLAGEPLTDEEVVARHAELMPDLVEDLSLANENCSPVPTRLIETPLWNAWMSSVEKPRLVNTTGGKSLDAA